MSVAPRITQTAQIRRGSVSKVVAVVRAEIFALPIMRVALRSRRFLRFYFGIGLWLIGIEKT